MALAIDVQRSGARPVLIVLSLLGTMALGVLVGSGHLSLIEMVSLAVLAGCIVVPWISVPAGILLLGFAGRYAIGPFVTGVLDIAFWTTLGLILLILSIPVASPMRSRVRWTHPVLLLFLGFLGFVFVSAYPTLGSSYGAEKLFRVTVYGLAFLLITHVLLSHAVTMQRFIIVFILFVDILALVSLILTIRTSGFLGILRIEPPGGGPITLARLIGFAAIACVGLALFHSRRKLLVINALGLIVIAFLTGSRAPAIFLVLVLGLFPLLTALHRQTRRQSGALLGALLLFVVLAVPGWQYVVNSDLPFANRFALLTEADRGASVEVRQAFYATALELSAERNGAGNGIGSWPMLTGMGDVRAYPHNVFLEILVEQGALALAAFGLFLVAVMVTGTRPLLSDRLSPRLSAFTIIGLASFIYAVLIAQTSGDLYDNRYIWFFAGFLLACDTMWHAEPRPVNRQGGPSASLPAGIQGR